MLKNLKKDSEDEIDDDDSNPTLDHLSRNDFSGNYENLIVSVNPAELKNLKLDTILAVELMFAYSLGIKDSAENETKYMRMIYLQDTLNNNSQKINKEKK